MPFYGIARIIEISQN